MQKPEFMPSWRWMAESSGHPQSLRPQRGPCWDGMAPGEFPTRTTQCQGLEKLLEGAPAG